MNKAYKFRIYPNKNQKELIKKTFSCTRFVYNYFLDQRIKMYKSEGESIGYTEQQNQLPEMKKELQWLKEVDSTSLQMSIRHLDRAFKNFFRDKRVGFPRFKSKRNNKKSYTVNYVNNNIQVKKNGIKLPKIKWISAKVHRFVKGRIINATVSKSPTNKYYVSLITECHIEQAPKKESNIGIDLGLSHFAIFSNGEKVDNPKYLKNSLVKLSKEQRKLSKKQKFSNNWYKQRYKVSKIHEKVKNQRQDFLHKLSKRIVDENQIIILEDLSVKNMMKDKNLSRGISDVGWSKFYSYLEYKTKWQGRTIHKIDRWFPSSKTCSHCGYIAKDMDLSIRKWDCPNCYTKDIDRDINASINILKEGLKEIKREEVA